MLIITRLSFFINLIEQIRKHPFPVYADFLISRKECFADLFHHLTRKMQTGICVIVSLAGPGIQLALFAALYAIRVGRPDLLLNLPDWGYHAFIFLFYVNLYWPLFNLLPVWPLDGGMVVRDLATHASPRQGLRFSLALSGAVAAAIAVNSLLAARGRGFLPDWVPAGGMFTVLLFGLLAYESFQLMSRIPPARAYEPDDRLPWEREREPEPWER